MFTYMLIVALTNLVMGIVLGYFYGPLFWQSQRVAPSDADHSDSATGQASEPTLARDLVDTHAMDTTKTVEASPPQPASAVASTLPNSEDLRPIKPTGSREVSALDLADVMSEMGVDSPVPTAP